MQTELATGARMQSLATVSSSNLWTGKEGHDACLDDIMAALKEGRRAETDCSDNLLSMAMVFAAIESAKRGEKVPVFLEQG